MPSEPESTPTAVETAPSPAKAPVGISTGKRVAIGINVLTQAIIVLFILGLVNWMSARHFKRWDRTRGKDYTLSELSKNTLANLQKPVTAIVYFGGGLFAEVSPDVKNLLQEYEYASKGKLTSEAVDPYRNLQRATELLEKYKIGDAENIVILDYDGKSKFVHAKDMVELDMSGVTEQKRPRIKTFKGEAIITATLLELIEGRPNKVYLTSGHGENQIVADSLGRPDDVSIFGELLKRTNIKHEALNLMDAERVPEDATALMIFGPKQDLSEREITLLDNYWTNKGRIMVMLRGNIKTPRLNAWLSKSGITPLGGQIFAQRVTRSVTGEREVQIIQDGVGKFGETVRPIIGDLVGQNAPLLGPTTGFEIDKSKATSDNLRFNVLIESAKQFWVELDPFDGQTAPTRDPAREKEGPFTLAVSAEKGGLEGLNVDTARMVVIGNAGFLTDGAVNTFSTSLDFSINTIQWLLNREKGIGVGIPPKEKTLVGLTMNDSTLGRLATAVIIGLPTIVAFFGIVICLQRRR